MNIFEIDESIFNCIDPETGEITDYELYSKLNEDRDRKIENTALACKDRIAMLEALENEKKKLEARIRVCKNQVAGLKNLLDYSLQGGKFETPRCAVSYRRSSKTEIDNAEQLLDWARSNGRKEFIRQAEPSVSVSAVADALKQGEDIPFCHTEETTSVQVK